MCCQSARYIGRPSDKHARPIKYNLACLLLRLFLCWKAKLISKLNHEVASLVWIPFDFFSNAENQEERCFGNIGHAVLRCRVTNMKNLLFGAYHFLC